MNRVLVIAGLALALLTSCAPPIFVGCNNDGDCPVRCEEGGEFEDGLCTQTCDDNLDCPGGTLCIDERDGVCLVECSSQDQCRAFGRGYVCRDLRDTDGDLQLVCLGR